MFSARLKQLRLARGLSLDELSALIGGIVTKQALSKYETGKANPSPIVLKKLASALGVKPDYFATQPSLKITFAYRKRASLSQKEMLQLQNQVTQALEERIRLQELTLQSSSLAFQNISIATLDEVESAAEQVRQQWNLGNEPITSVVETLESHLVHVLQIDSSGRFDGMAAIARDEITGGVKAAMVVTRSDVSGGRQRLSLMHELGHLLLSPNKDLDEEKIAFRFGGAMLAPANRLRREVGTHRVAIGLGELLILKKRFGISIQALLMRLRDLKIISESYYKSWVVQISAWNWKKQEPFELEQETPTWLRTTVYRAFAEGLIGRDQFEQFLRDEVSDRTMPFVIQDHTFSNMSLSERRQLLDKEAQKKWQGLPKNQKTKTAKS